MKPLIILFFALTFTSCATTNNNWSELMRREDLRQIEMRNVNLQNTGGYFITYQSIKGFLSAIRELK
jgi:hypothetical protein